MNKKLLILPVIVTILGISGFLIPKVYSAENTSYFPPFLQKLEEKFKLNKNDLQNFWNEFIKNHQKERQQERKQEIIDRLTELIKLKKLSESQKSELLAIIEKHQNAVNDFKDRTAEERQQIQKEHRNEVEAWTKKNGINLDDLNIGFFGRGNRGMSGKGMMGKFIKN